LLADAKRNGQLSPYVTRRYGAGELPSGCIRADAPGTEIQVVKDQVGSGVNHVCVRLPQRVDCLWVDAFAIETKDDWAHDQRNPNSDVALQQQRQRHDNCVKVIASLDRNPNVKRLAPFNELLPTYSHRFDASGTPDITINCGVPPTDMIVSLDAPKPTPQFMSFFGALAHDVTGVDGSAAIDGALRCYGSAIQLKGASDHLFEGQPEETASLHLDCRVGENFISLGVYRPH